MSNSFLKRFKKSNETEPVVEKDVPVWEDRIFWVETLQKIAGPVLSNLSKNSLKKNMVIESKSSQNEKFAYLEAFARVFNGIAPWLELGGDETEEGKLRSKYIKLTIKAISNAVNPKSKDYIFYSEPKQSLVDMALFAQGLLRSKNQIWVNLPMDVQSKITEEFKNSRVIAPYENHWLVYTSMIEAALLEFTGQCDKQRLVYAIQKFRDDWYIGDGIYADGEDFSVDYLNGSIIHPMINDILMVLRKYNLPDGEFLDVQLMRSSRLSAQLERIISPEGTFPVFGRSISYRCGIFHTLSQVTLFKILPKNIEPAQVRCALTKVLERCFKDSDNLSSEGWLLLGLTGNQKDLCEANINTGSLYLCMSVFLVLGLDSNDVFWSDSFKEWSSLKAWGGHDCQADQAIDF